MYRVLFVCVHNSARSQMAEEMLRLKSGGTVFAESAGLEPGQINPIVADVLLTRGIDIRAKQTKDVFDLYRQGNRYHYVITVCDAGNSERCPIFPGAMKYLHWSFPDPSRFEGSYEDKFNQTREVLSKIESKIEELWENIKS